MLMGGVNAAKGNRVFYYRVPPGAGNRFMSRGLERFLFRSSFIKREGWGGHNLTSHAQSFGAQKSGLAKRTRQKWTLTEDFKSVLFKKTAVLLNQCC